MAPEPGNNKPSYAAVVLLSSEGTNLTPVANTKPSYADVARYRPIATNVVQKHNYVATEPTCPTTSFQEGGKRLRQVMPERCIPKYSEKKGQSSVVSGTSDVSSDQRDEYDNRRLQTDVGQKRTIISEGTYEGTFSLEDLVQLHRMPVNAQLNDRLKSLKKIVKNDKIVDKNGHPSTLLLQLWRDLQNIGIPHGYLNPKCILLSQKGLHLRAELISDASIGKQLSRDSPYLNTGCDILEWLAPEQRKDPSIRTFSADIYSLGAIFLYCITGVRPSIDELKTVKNKSIASLVGCPEADDLILCMLMKNPKSRQTAVELLDHPVFWSSEKRISFLRDTSEKINPRYPDDLLRALEGTAVDQIAEKGNRNKVETWDQIIHAELISYVKKRNWTYDFGSVRDLVRFIRNTKVHYRKLPTSNKEICTNFFTERFPRLLIEVYRAVSKFSKNDRDYFCRYFGGDPP